MRTPIHCLAPRSLAGCFSASAQVSFDRIRASEREPGNWLGEAEYKPGALFNGGGFRDIPGERGYGMRRAFQPASGEIQWEYKIFTAPWAGVLSTAGGLYSRAPTKATFWRSMRPAANHFGAFKRARRLGRIR